MLVNQETKSGTCGKCKISFVNRIEHGMGSTICAKYDTKCLFCDKFFLGNKGCNIHMNAKHKEEYTVLHTKNYLKKNLVHQKAGIEDNNISSKTKNRNIVGRRNIGGGRCGCCRGYGGDGGNGGDGRDGGGGGNGED
jgi:hypothetical protein